MRIHLSIWNTYICFAVLLLAARTIFFIVGGQAWCCQNHHLIFFLQQLTLHRRHLFPYYFSFRFVDKVENIKYRADKNHRAYIILQHGIIYIIPCYDSKNYCQQVASSRSSIFYIKSTGKEELFSHKFPLFYWVKLNTTLCIHNIRRAHCV